MTDPKDFDTLDELYRKTFDNLPAQPAATGWDTPSEQVWAHVQARIKPPSSGWTAQKLGLISAFAVSLALGLYLYFMPADPPASAPAPAGAAPVETPAAPVEAPEPTAAVPLETFSPASPAGASANAGAGSALANRRPVTPSHATAPGTPTPDAPEEASPTPRQARPLPGSEDTPFNNLERRRARNTAEQLWQVPLAPLPGAGHNVPTVPEGLKYLGEQ